MRGVSIRTAGRRAWAGQGRVETLFDVDSLSDLTMIQSQTALAPGSPFTLSMTLRAPVAHAFNGSGAEALFRPVVPPGLTLRDVHSSGPNIVVVEMVVDAAQSQAGQNGTHAAAMGFVVVLAAVAAFLAAHWVGLSLAVIGLAVSLGFLVSSIRGEGVQFVEGITGGVGDIARWVAVGLIAFVALQALGTVKR